MQKENPFWNSVRQIKIRCAKYKNAKRIHNSLMQYRMRLIFGEFLDLVKGHPCAKGKSNGEFRSVKNGIGNVPKIKIRQKSTKEWFDRAALWRLYVYFISLTSMQKENPVPNSIRPKKFRCAKYKNAKRGLNSIMQ